MSKKVTNKVITYLEVTSQTHFYEKQLRLDTARLV